MWPRPVPPPRDGMPTGAGSALHVKLIRTNSSHGDPPRDPSGNQWGSRDPSQERYSRGRDPPDSPHPPRRTAAAEGYGDTGRNYDEPTRRTNNRRGDEPRRGDSSERGSWTRRDEQPRIAQGEKNFPRDLYQGFPRYRSREAATPSRPRDSWPARSRSRDPPSEGPDGRANAQSRGDRFAQNSQSVTDPPATRPVPGRAPGNPAAARQTRFVEAVVNTMIVDDHRDNQASPGPLYAPHEPDAFDDNNAPASRIRETAIELPRRERSDGHNVRTVAEYCNGPHTRGGLPRNSTCASWTNTPCRYGFGRGPEHRLQGIRGDLYLRLRSLV